MSLFVDLDGVLANFHKRASEIVGKKTFTDKELWDALKPHIKAGRFWNELERMPDADFLWFFVKDKNPTILTSSGHIAPELTAKLKRDWVRENFGNVPVIVVREAKEKIPYSSRGNVLIDDRSDTIEKWSNAGGTGILHRSAKETVEELKKIGYV